MWAYQAPDFASRKADYMRYDAPMQTDIEQKRDALAKLCRRYHVARLEVFGSAAREDAFDPARSDIDFLVTFERDGRDHLASFVDLKEALESLFQQPIDLVEREAIEESRNTIRKRAILNEAQAIYG